MEMERVVNQEDRTEIARCAALSSMNGNWGNGNVGGTTMAYCVQGSYVLWRLRWYTTVPGLHVRRQSKSLTETKLDFSTRVLISMLHC